MTTSIACPSWCTNHYEADEHVPGLWQHTHRVESDGWGGEKTDGWAVEIGLYGDRPYLYTKIDAASDELSIEEALDFASTIRELAEMLDNTSYDGDPCPPWCNSHAEKPFDGKSQLHISMPVTIRTAATAIKLDVEASYCATSTARSEVEITVDDKTSILLTRDQARALATTLVNLTTIASTAPGAGADPEPVSDGARVFDWEGREVFESCDTPMDFSWRDLPTMQTYGPREWKGEMLGLIPVDAHRDDLPFPVTAAIAHQVALSNTGGLLMWNETRNEPGGLVVMFTGQTRDEQRTVVENAGWWTSCGLTYAEREGRTHYRPPDDIVEIDLEEWHITYLDNNREVWR